MTEQRLITVAIHTYDRALQLRHILEREGVEVTLQNVNLTNPVVSSGVRMRIREEQLPMALRILENLELFESSVASESPQQPVILVPVDFSTASYRAIPVAFRLAVRHNATIHLLHAFADPASFDRLQLADSLSYDSGSEDIDKRHLIENEARRQMEILTTTLLDKIKSGDIMAAKYTTEVVQGLPEDVINQYVKTHNPLLVVMGTRGADTKERELVGSVTAEVLDTCRHPIVTVPDSAPRTTNTSPHNILFLSNFDQEDILALDEMFRLIPGISLNVTLLKLPTKKNSGHDEQSLTALGTYCRTHYPEHHFSIDTLSFNSVEDDFQRLMRDSNIDVIAVPNKKKNIFARLFNPGIAHRLLFHSDIPMIVIPV